MKTDLRVPCIRIRVDNHDCLFETLADGWTYFGLHAPSKPAEEEIPADPEDEHVVRLPDGRYVSVARKRGFPTFVRDSRGRWTRFILSPYA